MRCQQAMAAPSGKPGTPTSAQGWFTSTSGRASSQRTAATFVAATAATRGVWVPPWACEERVCAKEGEMELRAMTWSGGCV